MDARAEQRSLVGNPLPTQYPDLIKLPPLSRALECELKMIEIQTEIDRLAKLHISHLADQMQDLSTLRQEAIKEAATAGIKQDERAVLVEKKKKSPRVILAKVLKEKDEPLYNAVINAQEIEIDREKAALKDQKEMPIGVTEKCYKEIHGKGFDTAPIFEPIITKIDYSVISIEAKKIQDAIEASKKAKKKVLTQ